MVHEILMLLSTEEIAIVELYYVFIFKFFVDKLQFLLHRIKLQLIKHTCAQNKSERPDLFGSKVIDILDCILDCRKDITVKTSGVWCYIKGQYEVNGALIDGLPGGASGLEPLNAHQQLELYIKLCSLARWSNNYHHWRQWRYEEFDIDFCEGLCELDATLRYDDLNYRKLYGKFFKEKPRIMFKVDLKCKKELAPIELLPELINEPSYDYTEDKSAPGANTVQNSSPDLELKLEIHWRPFLSTRGTDCHKYLIQQWDTDS
jgi:hypothetical protein